MNGRQVLQELRPTVLGDHWIAVKECTRYCSKVNNTLASINELESVRLDRELKEKEGRQWLVDCRVKRACFRGDEKVAGHLKVFDEVWEGLLALAEVKICHDGQRQQHVVTRVI